MSASSACAREARQIGVRMDLHRDLAEAVERLGGPAAVGALGTATANRAVPQPPRLGAEAPDQRRRERCLPTALVFRSWRVLSAGRVYTTGRARVRRTVLRVGDWRVLRRDGISFPLARAAARRGRHAFTRGLQGINNPAADE